jgi:hypothetical protein
MTEQCLYGMVCSVNGNVGRALQNERHVPKGLRKKVLEYSEMFSSRSAFFDEFGVLSELTEGLRRDAVLHINREVVATVHVFQHLEPSVLAHILSIVTPAFAFPNETVLHVSEAVSVVPLRVTLVQRLGVHASTSPSAPVTGTLCLSC